MSQPFDPPARSRSRSRAWPPISRAPRPTTPSAFAPSGARSSTAAGSTAAPASSCSARTPASTRRSPGAVSSATPASGSRARSGSSASSAPTLSVNAFLYSVYAQPRRDELAGLLAATARYRKRRLDALLDGSDIRTVIAFGEIAEQAFLRWRRTASGRRFEAHFEPFTHPTMPDAAARPGSAAYRAGMRRLLEQWNAALERLDAALGAERDRRRTLAPYGDQLLPADRKQIPEQDLPAGTPPWMLSLKQWATRKGSSAELKRATIEVRVPASERPWE